MGGGLTHLSMCAKKSLFASILSCIPMQGISFYIVVFGIDYNHFLLNICYEYFPVSQKFYSIFLYGIIGWVFKKNNKLDINKWGGGLTHLSMCAKKSLFASILSCIPMQGISFYIVVFGIDYNHFSINICYEYFPVSQKFYSIFLYRIIGWVFKKTTSLILTNGGGLDTSKYVCKKVPLCLYFVMHSYARYFFLHCCLWH